MTTATRRKIRPLTTKEKAYLLLVLPGVIVMILFKYVPMFGIIMAFENYSPVKGFLGSRWVGLKNFRNLFRLPDVAQIFSNTLTLALWNIALGIMIPLLFALMLNEVRSVRLKRNIQTIVYMPHFLSWVILAVTFKQIFSGTGIVNQCIKMLGGDPASFLSNGSWFRAILIGTGQWKEFGWGTIIFLSAMLGIDGNLYEAASIDGATRFQRMLHITIPGIKAIILLKITLSLGSVLDANFDQVFNMYNTLVYDTADIIDTYVYRLGMINLQYSLSSAVGLLKSVISLLLIVAAYKLADRYAGYKIF